METVLVEGSGSPVSPALARKSSLPMPWGDYLSDGSFDLHPEHFFHSILETEVKRTERSLRPFLLVLVRIDRVLASREHFLLGIRDYRYLLGQISTTIAASTREIDTRGWFERGRTVGILCVEVNGDQRESIIGKLRSQIEKALGQALSSLIDIEGRLFPDSQKSNSKNDSSGKPGHDVLETPVGEVLAEHLDQGRVPARIAKRVLDIVGAVVGMVLFSPLFLLIPVLIKGTSAGPVFFRQKRVGRNGKVFTFYKFRSMYCNNDDSIHRQFVSKLIRGEVAQGSSDAPAVFKLKNDSRITSIGRLLRRTSLDEIPQFFNVLMGDMSLVGPRPAIPYEVEQYSIWHCRRILRCKPGITGFWQVEGRSSTTFENMVRMDIRYAMRRSFWLDVKLLFKTAFSVLAAKGAY